MTTLADLNAATDRTFTARNFTLESGATLPEMTLIFDAYGRLAPDGANGILVTHGYTGSHRAAGPPTAANPAGGWWKGDRVFHHGQRVWKSPKRGVGRRREGWRKSGLDLPATLRQARISDAPRCSPHMARPGPRGHSYRQRIPSTRLHFEQGRRAANRLTAAGRLEAAGAAP